jgi:uncharacterized membrane protein
VTRIRIIFDSFLSLLAAVLSLAVSIIPAWYAHMAIDSGLAPQWVYIVIAGLVFLGGVMVFAFLRKARNGVSPLRERKRR